MFVNTCMYGRKTWTSPSQDNAYNYISAWHWLLYREQHGIACATAGRWVKMLHDKSLIGSNDSGRIFIVLGTAYMMSIALEVTCMGKVDDTNIFVVEPRMIERIFVTNPSSWFVIPWSSVCPLEAERQCVGFAHVGILLKQAGAGVSMLRHAFAHRHSLSDKELELTAKHLDIDPIPNTAELILRDVCAALTRSESDEVRNAYIANALSLFKKPPAKKKNCAVVDPLSELTFGAPYIINTKIIHS